mgnify:CR=1 FL=1
MPVYGITGSDSISACTMCGYHKGLCRLCAGQKGRLGHKSGYAVSAAEYKGGRNEISAAIFIDLVYFICGRILKICIAITDSGKYLRNGHLLIKLEQVKDVGKFLIEIMPVMFIPAGVGLMESWGTLKPFVLPVSVITVITIVTVMAATGISSQWVIRKEKKQEGGAANE